MKIANFAKIMSLLLAAVLMMSLMAACGETTSKEPDEVSATEKTPAEESAAGETAVPEKTLKLSWAPAWDEEHGLTQAGIAANEKLLELSDGKLGFEFFPGGQLGNEREVFESIQLGTIDAAFMSSPVISGFSDVLNGFDMPYICDNDMELYQEIVNSGIGATMFEKLEAETGVVGLSYLINPGRDFYFNCDFESLDDAHGIKLRSMESPIHLETYKALGFNPTPMAYSEIYQAVKNGTIDGFEDVSVSVKATKNYEVAKTVAVSGHLTAAPVFIMSQKAWNSLTEEEQGWMLEAGLAAQEATKVSYMEQTPLTLKFMEEQGLKVVYIDIDEAKEKVQPVIDKFCAESENIKIVVDYFNEYRETHNK